MQATCSEPLSVQVSVTVPVAAGAATVLELPVHRVAVAAAAGIGSTSAASGVSSSGWVEVLEGGTRIAIVESSANKYTVHAATTPTPVGVGGLQLSHDAKGRPVVRTTVGSGSYDFVVRLHAQ